MEHTLNNYTPNPAFDQWQKKSIANAKQYSQLIKRANKNKVLKALPVLHEQAFEQIDCVQCAACCKHYSPRFRGPDIKRISKVLKIKETELIAKYLKVDEEEDYVTKSTPCPFLGTDNKCGIYEDRPSDCKRFPYTDEDVLLKRPRLTVMNASFCPAVYYVLERLKDV